MFSSPEFWVAVAFFIVVAAVFKPVSRVALAGLDARSARIRQQLEEAQNLREEAQKTLAEYQRMQRDAVRETEEILEHAKKEAAQLAERSKHDLEEQLRRRQEQAMEKIAQAEASALQEVRNQAVDVAVAATARLLQDRIDDTKAGALVDDAIRELPSKLN